MLDYPVQGKRGEGVLHACVILIHVSIFRVSRNLDPNTQYGAYWVRYDFRLVP